MNMLAAVRSLTDTDEAVTERLNALFATEAERVANAALLAELVAPMLADHLRPLTAPAIAPVAVAPVASLPPTAKPVQPRPGSIADFIDDMIAQEKPPERPGQGAQRRAS